MGFPVVVAALVAYGSFTAYTEGQLDKVGSMPSEIRLSTWKRRTININGRVEEVN